MSAMVGTRLDHGRKGTTLHRLPISCRWRAAHGAAASYSYHLGHECGCARGR
jgi:hypothetical protein